MQFTCPTCKKEIRAQTRDDAPFRPFCSPRCQWIDLGKWLDESYRISDPVSEQQWDADLCKGQLPRAGRPSAE